MMSMQNTLILFILWTLNFAIAGCVENPFAQSALPKEMPANAKMSYNRSGGMAPSWYRVEIKENRISVEDKDADKREANKWNAKINEEEKEAVYRVFVENRFDLIENEKAEDVVYDAGSESVSISAGGVSKAVSYGENSPLSKRNLARYSAAARVINALASNYKEKAEK